MLNDSEKLDEERASYKGWKNRISGVSNNGIVGHSSVSSSNYGGVNSGNSSKPKQASNVSASYNPSRVKKTEIKNNIQDSDEEEDRNKNKKGKAKKDESDEDEKPPQKKPQAKINSVPLKPLSNNKTTNNDEDFKEVIEEVVPNFKTNNGVSTDPFSFFAESKQSPVKTSNKDIPDFLSSGINFPQTDNNKSTSIPDIFSFETRNTHPPKTSNTASIIGKSFI